MWLCASVAKGLNERLPAINPAGGQSRTCTLDYRVSSPVP